MKKILFLLFIFLSVCSYAQKNGVYDVNIHATDSLETDANFVIASDTIVPILDVTYHQFSVDGISWTKDTANAEWVRFSNDVKNTWWILPYSAFENYWTVSNDTISTPYYFDVSGIDSIYVTKDSTFTIEYLKYLKDGEEIGVTDIPKVNGIFEGGIVTWQGDLDFAVSPAAYYISGDLYTSSSTELTLTTADATLDRIDVFLLDTTGMAYVKTGIPSVTPQEPSYNPTSEVRLTSVLLPAAETIPVPDYGGTILTEVVYDENVEWTSEAVTVVADFESTTSVHNGTVSAELGTMGYGYYVHWTNDTDIGSADYETLSMWVKLNSPLGKKDELHVSLQDNGVKVSPYSVIPIDKTTTDWQNVSLTLSEITYAATVFDDIRVSYFGGKSSDVISGIAIDYVVLQSGIEQPSNIDDFSIYDENQSKWLYNGDTIALISDYAPTDTIIQSSHGYIGGEWIAYDSTQTNTVLAQADSRVNADVIGIVKEIINDSTFTFQYGGIYESGTWAEGANYFLSPDVAGEETTDNTFSNGEVYQFLGTGIADNKLLISIDVGYVILVDSLEAYSLTTTGESGNIGIKDGNVITINVDDADNDPTNELDNTDDQVIDEFSLTGNTLSISIESDGEAAKAVDLSGFDGADSIFTTPDNTFPIEYLQYTKNGETIGVTDIAKPDGVYSGGIVTSQSGLTFNIGPAAYYIDGTLYTSGSTTLTLTAADGTNSRIDLFVVDTLGAVSYITGTPSINPQTPQYNPSSQLPLTSVLILANATEPSDPGGGSLVTELVYDENVEWTTYASGVVVDFAQTTTVHNGSIAAEGGTLSNGDYISFTSGTTIGHGVYETLSFWLKLKEAMWMKDDIIIQLYSNGNPIGQMVDINYNYQTTDWQFITVDMADFSTIALFDEIRITNDLFKATAPDGWFIDYVKLQGGIETPPTVGTGTDDQTASEVPVTVQNGIEQNNVQAELEAIRSSMGNLLPTATVGQLAVKGESSWVAVDPCDLLCVDSILAIIKSYLDTATTTPPVVQDSLLASVNASMVFSETLSFTPPVPLYGGAYSYGSSIVEDGTYIFAVFNDTAGGEYVNQYVVRYNKTTEVVDYQQITTTNAYGLDAHKLPCAIVTSDGSLLVAIEELPNNSSHNSIIDIFRWDDTSDLSTYTITSVGNTSTERLSYQYLYETSAGVILEARRYSGTPQWRNYYVSTNDGVSFGAANQYIDYGDSDYWMYTCQVGNNNTGDVILAIKPQNDESNANCYQYVTFLKTDFSGNFYSLDGTNLGTVVTGEELKTHYSWGNTDKNNLLYETIDFKIFSDKIISLGRIGTRTSTLMTIDSMQFFITDVNSGDVYSGNAFPYIFGSSTVSGGIIINTSDALYYKTGIGDSIYYYEIASDFNSMTLKATEAGDYSIFYNTDMNSELTLDYDMTNNVSRVFRFDSPDSLIFDFCEANLITTYDSVQVDSILTNIYFETTNATGIGSPAGLPTGISAAWSNDTITVSGTPTETGVFNYSIPLTGCDVSFPAMGTITVIDTLVTTPDTTLLTGLVASYELDETIGTTVIDSTGNNNATNVGATINQTGNTGGAYLFAEPDEYLTLPPFHYNPVTESYSVSLWVSSSDPNPTQTNSYLINDRGPSGNYSMQIYAQDNNALGALFVIYNGSSAFSCPISDASSQIWDGSWHHIVFTIDHTVKKITAYLDGSYNNETTYTYTSFTVSTNTYTSVGINETTSKIREYNGLLDQLRIYERVLTPTDVSNLSTGIPYSELGNY